MCTCVLFVILAELNSITDKFWSWLHKLNILQKQAQQHNPEQLLKFFYCLSVLKEDSDKVMAEKDPLNPENDIFWEGPGAIRPSLQKAAAEAKAKAEAEPRPYSLNPKPTILGNILSNSFVT